MKKIFHIFILISVLGLISACTKTDKKQNVQNTEKEIHIYFTRHGKTMLNTTDRVQGWCDSPLTDSGIEIAENTGKGLKEKISFDNVYSSDSGRAIETAKIIIKNMNQNLIVNQDKRLREFNYGSFEGAKNSEMFTAVAKENGKTINEYQSDIQKNGFATEIVNFSNTLATIDNKNTEKEKTYSAENYNQVVDRMKNALNDIVKNAQKNEEHNILVISHGMSISALLSSLDPESAKKIPANGLANASISKISYKNGKYTVETVNDVSFIENRKEKQI
ncbi:MULTISPECIES: histidine phosphatase family protein [unclassified Enterococcus]|uniref:histidine phosphatase family protein n=1 Tax=unclassified Enterococcus TaxID=2608891 RepID=UPI0013EAA3EC|nr:MULTISPECIES: histidine phosphatase family protein [unclassified Enterococcus]